MNSHYYREIINIFINTPSKPLVHWLLKICNLEEKLGIIITGVIEPSIIKIRKYESKPIR
jgi:hypothetical protein